MQSLWNTPSITSFSGEYRWLSNFYPSPLTYGGVVFPTVENAYQAQKTKDTDLQRMVDKMKPGQAKSWGKLIELRDDWEDVKLGIMQNCVHLKFWFGYPLFWKLMDTKDSWLIEGNRWGDKFWGAVWDQEKQTWDGQNRLGEILMNIRELGMEEYDEFPTYESFKIYPQEIENYWGQGNE